MINIRTLSVGVAALAVLVACDERVPTEVTPQAQVRFVHAAPGVDALDFRLNGDVAGPNVAFGTPSVCRVVDFGDVSFTAVHAGTGTTFGAPLGRTLTANGRFTVLATGTADDPHFLFLDDATAAPAAGQARVRIVHALPGVAASDVFLTAPEAELGTPFATGIGFNVASPFVDMPAGETQIRFTGAGTQDVTFTGAPVTLTAGQTTTIILTPGETEGTFEAFAVAPC
jgi:hypothetical protein